MHNVEEYSINVTNAKKSSVEFIPKEMQNLFNTLMEKAENFSVDFSLNKDDGYLTVYLFIKNDINLYKFTVYIFDNMLNDYTSIIPKDLIVSAIIKMNNTLQNFI